MGRGVEQLKQRMMLYEFSKRMNLQESLGLLHNDVDSKLKRRLLQAFEAWYDYTDYDMHCYVLRKFFSVLDAELEQKGSYREDHVKRLFFENIGPLKWNRWYDFFEFLLTIEEGEVIDFYYTDEGFDLAETLNESLQDGLSAYRVLDRKIVPIVLESEIDTVDSARDLLAGYESLEHLEEALKILSSKTAVSYVNVTKEAIHIVESYLMQLFNNKDTLSKNLKLLRGDLHPALINSLDKLYGWASDTSVRHGKNGPQMKIGLDEAKLCLVLCCAIVNYIIALKIQLNKTEMNDSK